jgi:hypothetical protein
MLIAFAKLCFNCFGMTTWLLSVMLGSVVGCSLVVTCGAMPSPAIFFIGRDGRIGLCPPPGASGCHKPLDSFRYHGSSLIVIVECCWVGVPPSLHGRILVVALASFLGHHVGSVDLRCSPLSSLWIARCHPIDLTIIHVLALGCMELFLGALVKALFGIS